MLIEDRAALLRVTMEEVGCQGDGSVISRGAPAGCRSDDGKGDRERRVRPTPRPGGKAPR